MFLLTNAPDHGSLVGYTGGPINTNIGGLPLTNMFLSGMLVPPAVPPTISKAFSPTSIPSGGTSVVTLTLSNSSTIALTNATFTDTLTNMSATGSVTGTCGGTLSGGPMALSFTGITIPASSSCTVIFSVTSSTPGNNNNTTSGVTTTQTPTAGTSSNTATLTVVAPPSIGKSFGAATIPLNGTTTLSFTITNPNASTPLTGVNFTDTLPAGLSASGTATGNCNGGTVLITSGIVSLSGGSIASAGSCTISGITITGITAGVQNNSVTVGSANGGNNAAPGTASVIVVAPPSIAKTFSPNKFVPGGTTSVSFVITNPNSSVGLTGLLSPTRFPPA